MPDLLKNMYNYESLRKLGCRTLLKKNNRDVLALFGFHDVTSITVEDFALGTTFLVSSSDSYLLDERIELVEMIENIIQEQSKENIIPSLQFESKMEILGNIAMLHRALSNLVENAIKYNRPEGRVNIFVTKKNPWAVITIEDTGIDIAPEHLPHIFQPFYRADASRSRNIGGSGLGLAIAKDTVQRHGGAVSASSTIGVGSTFIVRIPIIRQVLMFRPY